MKTKWTPVSLMLIAACKSKTVTSTADSTATSAADSTIKTDTL